MGDEGRRQRVVARLAATDRRGQRAEIGGARQLDPEQREPSAVGIAAEEGNTGQPQEAHRVGRGVEALDEVEVPRFRRAAGVGWRRIGAVRGLPLHVRTRRAVVADEVVVVVVVVVWGHWALLPRSSSRAATGGVAIQGRR